MKTFVRLLLLTVAIAMGTSSAHATLYQVILVNVVSPQILEVDGKRCRIEDLTAAVASRVRGPDRIMIKLLVNGSVNKVEEKRIIELCRKAGARSFFVGFKD